MSKRYIPISETDESISQLNLARIETTKGYLNNNSHGELPSSESPFNPILSYDVQYYEPRLQRRNRVLTKYENKANETNDIALYNTRTHALNAEDVAGLDNLQLHKEGMERARSKVKQRWEDYVPQENSNQNVFNGNVFNPGLPISETNKPSQGYKAGMVDERLGWFTNGREFRYESDIANNAYNLQRSQEIIDRNRRQAEADDALFHRHQKNRWVEPKQAYRDRAYVPTYEREDFVKHDMSKGNDRQVGNLEKEKFNIVGRSKKLQDVEHMNKVRNDVEQSFQSEYERKQIQQTMKRWNDSRDGVNGRMIEAFEVKNTNSGVFGMIADKLFDVVKESLSSLLGSGLKEEKRQRSKLMEREGFDEYKQRMLVSDGMVYDEVFGEYKEKFGFKPNHLLIMRDGNIPAVYPDDDFSNTAPTFIMRDPFDGGIVKSVMLIDGTKFKIIQKHESDRVFSGDNRPYGEDYIVSEVLIEDLPPQMKERIKIMNMNSKRDKTLELCYDDWIAFSDYVVKHIDTADRIKFADIWRKIRGNDFDEQLVNNFEGRKVLVDESAVQDAVAELRKDRMRNEVNERMYSKHEQKEIMDINDVEMLKKAPINSSKLPSSGEAYRPVQINDTPFATKRTNGVNMKKFNV